MMSTNDKNTAASNPYQSIRKKGWQGATRSVYTFLIESRLKNMIATGYPINHSLDRLLRHKPGDI